MNLIQGAVVEYCLVGECQDDTRYAWVLGDCADAGLFSMMTSLDFTFYPLSQLDL